MEPLPGHGFRFGVDADSRASARAALDQNHAAAVDALRLHSGGWVLVLCDADGDRVLAGLLADVPAPVNPDWVGNQVAANHFARCAAALRSAAAWHVRKGVRG